jgi:hypothetical protein
MDRAVVSDGAVVIERTTGQIRWTAVIAGWLVAAGIAYVLYVFGLAVGFTALDISTTEQTAEGIGVGAAIWVIVTWCASLFLGGMFASWLDGSADQTIGALHGVVVWGLAVTATGLLVALGATQALQGAASVLDPEGIARETIANRQDAEAAARYQASAMWVLFGSTLLAAVAAAAGGWLGGGHIHRVYDPR